MFHKTLISICIPVYKTENILEACVNSVIAQDFKQMEIIIVDDGSEPVNPQLTVQSICKKLKKNTHIPITLIQHSSNKGLLEARRTAVYAAKGEYIFNLDSDDSLPPDAIKTLYNKAKETDYDVIQGEANICGNVNSEILKKKNTSINRDFNSAIIWNNEATNPILDAYLVDNKISGFLWGKLIRREVYLEALNRIPPITCTFAEDYIQSLWIYQFSKSYICITDKIYNYSMESGISSQTLITDLSRWEKVCSTSGVFTAIITECEENGNPFSEQQMDKIREMCRYYVFNNLMQLEKSVSPEIKDQAYEMLCEYWGRGLVETVKSHNSVV